MCACVLKDSLIHLLLELVFCVLACVFAGVATAGDV